MITNQGWGAIPILQYDKNMTFFEIYQERKNQPTPAQRWVTEVAMLTDRSEQTVRMWLSGVQIPDSNVIKVLAQHFKCKASDLFPAQNA